MNFKDDANFWSRAQTVQLINEYKKHELLYKVSHPDYYTVQKKIQAFAQIVDALKPIKPKVSVKDIKSKIKVLNAQLRIEKRRMLANATANGNSKEPEENYVSTLWCFKYMQFLLNVNDDVQSASNIDESTLADVDASTSTNVAVAKVSPKYLTSERIERKSNDARILQKKRRLNYFTDTDENEADQATYEDTNNHNKNCKQSNYKNDDIAAELRQTARQSLELMTKFMKEAKQQTTKPQETGKEEIFCQMLCSELKQLKLEETYDEVTAELFAVIKKAKVIERKKLSKEHANTFENNSQSEAIETIEIDPLQFSHRNSSKVILHE